MIPELEHLVQRGRQSGDPAKEQAADALHQKIGEVLNSANHRWYLNKVDPAEEAERQRRREEFQQRYGK
jgi:hypothetical protein